MKDEGWRYAYPVQVLTGDTIVVVRTHSETCTGGLMDEIQIKLAGCRPKETPRGEESAKQYIEEWLRRLRQQADRKNGRYILSVKVLGRKSFYCYHGVIICAATGISLADALVAAGKATPEKIKMLPPAPPTNLYPDPSIRY